jgi:hypothetical protein
VRRQVDGRDARRCRFVAADGRRCDERRFLEYHHVVPYATGGPPTVDNIQLRCRAHNGYEADQFFGPGRRRTRGDAVRDDRAVYRGGVPAPGTGPGTSTRPHS